MTLGKMQTQSGETCRSSSNGLYSHHLNYIDFWVRIYCLVIIFVVFVLLTWRSCGPRRRPLRSRSRPSTYFWRVHRNDRLWRHRNLFIVISKEKHIRQMTFVRRLTAFVLRLTTQLRASVILCWSPVQILTGLTLSSLICCPKQAMAQKIRDKVIINTNHRNNYILDLGN